MLRNLGIDEFTSVRLECCESAFLVNTHQAAVASDIGREDGSQPPFDPRLGHKNRLYQQHFPDGPYGRDLGVSIEAIMSALGQKQTFCDAEAMSALPPKADICSALAHVP